MSDSNPASLTLPTPPVPFRTSEAERQAIIAERLAGVTVKDIAQRYGINPITVWRICKDTKRTAAKLAQDWRAAMKLKAIRATNAGLDAIEDPYKRGTLGVQALKGLGEFAGDTQVTVQTLIASAPAEVSAIVQALPDCPTLTNTPDSTPPPVDAKEFT